MKDPRINTLADILINYATRLQAGEKLLIEDFGINRELVSALVAEAYKAGGVPEVKLHDAQVDRALQLGYSQDGLDWVAALDARRMSECQAYIGVRGGDNAFELSDVPDTQKTLYSLHYGQPVHHKIRVPHTKWVVLRYPNSAMAQLAGMSTQQFEDFYFKVCTLDYSKMSLAMDPLVERMQRTDRVHLKGPGTDLRFSIKGQPAIKCDGRLNIPDGEVFTAPIIDSIEGTLQYNTPTLYQGVTHENVRLVFSKGRITEASSSRSDLLNRILDTDAGARGIGEFAIGVNPYILEPMKDTLFDEKICGSFHFTPGNSYDDCPNGNHSAIHWDMVCIQRADYGGGEMWFDGELVRKDGLFLPASLQGLNPDRF
ncbi:MAG: aminopeptidase [Christensenellales bacterium]